MRGRHCAPLGAGALPGPAAGTVIAMPGWGIGRITRSTGSGKRTAPHGCRTCDRPPVSMCRQSGRVAPEKRPPACLQLCQRATGGARGWPLDQGAAAPGTSAAVWGSNASVDASARPTGADGGGMLSACRWQAGQCAVRCSSASPDPPRLPPSAPAHTVAQGAICPCRWAIARDTVGVSVARANNSSASQVARRCCRRCIDMDRSVASRMAKRLMAVKTDRLSTPRSRLSAMHRPGGRLTPHDGCRWVAVYTVRPPCRPGS